MNTCKTCKWWPETDFVQHQFHPDTANWIRERETTTRECTNPKLNGDTDGTSKFQNINEARPEAADFHGICFMTGAEFGCIHHEPK